MYEGFGNRGIIEGRSFILQLVTLLMYMALNVIKQNQFVLNVGFVDNVYGCCSLNCNNNFQMSICDMHGICAGHLSLKHYFLSYVLRIIVDETCLVFS